MGYFSKFLGVAAAITLLSATVVGAEEKDPLKPRVPADQIADAKALKNPVANTPESVAKGKALFEGKGTCFNCHGKEGKGDGPAGAILNPSPRNFTNGFTCTAVTLFLKPGLIVPENACVVSLACVFSSTQ